MQDSFDISLFFPQADGQGLISLFGGRAAIGPRGNGYLQYLFEDLHGSLTGEQRWAERKLRRVWISGGARPAISLQSIATAITYLRELWPAFDVVLEAQ